MVSSVLQSKQQQLGTCKTASIIVLPGCNCAPFIFSIFFFLVNSCQMYTQNARMVATNNEIQLTMTFTTKKKVSRKKK